MAVAATSGERPQMIFHPVAEPRGANNTLRLILLTEHYDEETERLTGLGATPLGETRLPAVRWTTAADRKVIASMW